MKKYPRIIKQETKKIKWESFITSIFDASNNYFNQKEEFDKVCSIRHFVIEFLLSKQPKLLAKILNEYMVYPELFREIVCHLILIEQEKKVSFKLSKIVNPLIASLVEYRVNSSDPKHEEYEMTYLLNRKTVLVYFKSFLSNEKALNKIFKSAIFVEYFCILLIEPPIRAIIYDSLFVYLESIKGNERANEYLNDDNDDDGGKEKEEVIRRKKELDKSNQRERVSPYLCKFISKVFKCSFHYFPQKEKTRMLLSFKRFIEFVLSDEFFTKEMAFIHDLLHSLTDIKVSSFEADKIDDLLKPLFEFLIRIYETRPIEISDIVQLEAFVNHFLPKLNEIEIIKVIIKMIGVTKYEIKNGIFLCPFIRIFTNTGQIVNVLSYISNLCSKAPENCVKCHEYEVDKLILSTISKWRKNIFKLESTQRKETVADINSIDDFFKDTNDALIQETEDGLEINEELIDEFLNLFTQIAAVASSAPIVQNFFSILCPFTIDCASYLSMISKNVIHSLNTILKNTKNYSDSFLPIPSKPVPISSIPFNLFSDGITFTFWIFKSESLNDFEQNVVEFNEMTSNKQQPINRYFHISIVRSHLNIKIKIKKIIKSFPLDLDIPYNAWSMVSVTLIPELQDSSKSHLILHANGVEIKETEIDMSFIPKKNVNILINNSNNSVIQELNLRPHLMGAFSLSQPLSTKDIFQFSFHGQKMNCFLTNEHEDKLIFSYKPELSEKEFVYKVVDKNSTHFENGPQIEYNFPFSFFDVLYNIWNIDIIIPIFDQSNLRLINGSQIEYHNYLGTEVLSNLFNIGIDVQQTFYESNYFLSVSHYLQYSEEFIISYDLYIHFYDLLYFITFKELQIQLIDTILMNFNLWSRSKKDNLEKIVDHWKSFLFFHHKSLIVETKNPEYFLSCVPKCCDLDNLEDQSYLNCRNSLFSISLDLLQSIKDKTVSISNVIKLVICPEKNLNAKTDLFNFLLDKILSNQEIDLFSIPLLLILDDEFINNDEFVYKLIKLYVKFYKTQRFQPGISLNELIQNIYSKLNIFGEHLFPNEIFLALLSLMNEEKAVEMLPMLCINVIRKGEEYFNHLNNHMNKEFDYFVDVKSTIYPILLIIKFKNDEVIYTKAIELNLSIFKQHLIEFIKIINIFEFFDVEMTVLNRIKREIYLKILDQKLIHLRRMNKSKCFIEIVTNFIFFRTDKSPTIFSYFLTKYKDFKREINPETFSLKKFGTESEEDFNILHKFEEFIQSIDKNYMNFNLNPNEIKYQIGLRIFNNNKSWTDLDLAIKTFKFYRFNVDKKIIVGADLHDTINTLANCIYKFNETLINAEKAKFDQILELNISGNFDLNKLGKLKKETANYKVVLNEAIKMINSFLTSFKSIQTFFENLEKNKKKDEQYLNSILNSRNQTRTDEKNSFFAFLDSQKSTRSAWSKLDLVEKRENFESFEIEKKNKNSSKRRSGSFKNIMIQALSPHKRENEISVNLNIFNFEMVPTFCVASVVFNPDESNLHFKFVDSLGNSHCYSGNLSPTTKEFKINYNKRKIHNKKEKEPISSPVFISHDVFCFIDKSNKTIQIVSDRNKSDVKYIDQEYEIVSIQTNPDGWIAVSSEDTSVSVYNVDGLPMLKSIQTFSALSHSSVQMASSTSTPQRLKNSSLSSLQSASCLGAKAYSYKDFVECIAISSKQLFFVCGTKDNCLLFCQFCSHKISINKVVSVEGTPEKIIITKSDKYIAVLMKIIEKDRLTKKLAILNAEGKILRSFIMNVVAMTCENGFIGELPLDYLILAGDKNSIFVFNTLDMNSRYQRVFKCKSKILQLSYVKEISRIVAFYEDKTAVMVYHKLKVRK